MYFLIIIDVLFFIFTSTAQTTADLPLTQPTAFFSATIYTVDTSHDFNPECNDQTIVLPTPTLAEQIWWSHASPDHWGGLGVAFTNAYIDASDTIIYESPLSDLVWRSWSHPSYHKPLFRVNGVDHCWVNSQIAYLINFDDRTQWKRFEIQSNAGSSGINNFIPQYFDFDVNSGDIVNANDNTCAVTVTTPTCAPTSDPTMAPTNNPTNHPTTNPTTDPTFDPTRDPTTKPTVDPTINPTVDPTSDPTQHPTVEPTKEPTNDPTTTNPTSDPTFDPTIDPTVDPTKDPTTFPTKDPTFDPTIDPTVDPTTFPTKDPTKVPTSSAPTRNPTGDPTYHPTIDPINEPTIDPTTDPTADPTFDPTYNPTIDPTKDPTTSDPTRYPIRDPTNDPTIDPTIDPTFDPTTNPTKTPTLDLISDTASDDSDLTIDPTINPTVRNAYDGTFQIQQIALQLKVGSIILGILCIIGSCCAFYKCKDNGKLTEDTDTDPAAVGENNDKLGSSRDNTISISISLTVPEIGDIDDEVDINEDYNDEGIENVDDDILNGALHEVLRMSSHNDGMYVNIDGKQTETRPLTQELKNWLKEHHLDQYLDNFRENGYESLDYFKDINDVEDLIEIGIKNNEDRHKLMRLIELL